MALHFYIFRFNGFMAFCRACISVGPFARLAFLPSVRSAVRPSFRPSNPNKNRAKQFPNIIVQYECAHKHVLWII